MTEGEIKLIWEERGIGIALAVLEEAGLPEDEEEALAEQLEAWEAERIKPWLRRKVAWAFDPHEF